MINGGQYLKNTFKETVAQTSTIPSCTCSNMYVRNDENLTDSEVQIMFALENYINMKLDVRMSIVSVSTSYSKLHNY